MAALLAAGAPGIYNTTKFAVRGMSGSLRASLAPHGIGVSVLCPGLVKSYIYASDDIRPDRLKGDARPVDRNNVQRLADIRKAARQRVEHDPSLESRDRGAETEMHALSE